jgi:prepilin-type N-terminal cleavage/methylation domain-containing protein
MCLAMITIERRLLESAIDTHLTILPKKTRSTMSKASHRRQRNGFSLLELLAVVTILGIIALVVIPRISASAATAKENACFQNKAEINSAVERFYFDNASLPTNLAAINIAAYFPDGVPVCPSSSNAYTLDGTTKRVVGHTAGSHP